MKKAAVAYLSWYAKQEKIVKILLCLLWDIPSNLNRFFQSAKKGHLLGMVLAVVLGIVGGWFLFVLDIVTLVLFNKLFWLS